MNLGTNGHQLGTSLCEVGWCPPKPPTPLSFLRSGHQGISSSQVWSGEKRSKLFSVRSPPPRKQLVPVVPVVPTQRKVDHARQRRALPIAA